VKLDPQSLMKQAQEVRDVFDKKIRDLRVEASAGGGMVRAVVDGSMRIVSVTIDPSVVNPEDVGMLQDLVFAAVAEAQRKANDEAQEAFAAVTGDLADVDFSFLSDLLESNGTKQP
jgi:nucleoid-associated protein EbfC